MNGASSWTKLAIVLTLVGVSVTRFVGLEQSPPGFWIDEAATATHIICLRQTGSDAYRQHLPLFSTLFDAFVTTPELYLGALWTSVFGDSIASFRALAAFATTVTIAALGALCIRLRLGRMTATWAMVLASISPWVFQFSRIAWDPPLAPCFLVLGLLAFLGSNGFYSSALAGAGFALAMYSYPPFRVTVPLLTLGLIVYSRAEPGFSWRRIAISISSALLLSLPLLRALMSGELLGRSRYLSIFSPYYLEQFGGFSIWLVVRIFIENLLAHFSWTYLLDSGDANLRHSTQRFGEWSYVDAALALAGVVLALRRTLFEPLDDSAEAKFDAARRKRLLMFCIYGYLAGIVPAALTWQEIPHALRSIGAWPFLALGLAIIATRLCDLFSSSAAAISTASLLFFAYFSSQYFTAYPPVAQKAFVSTIKKGALASQRLDDWRPFEAYFQRLPDLAKYYYYLHYRPERCTAVPEHMPVKPAHLPNGEPPPGATGRLGRERAQSE